MTTVIVSKPILQTARVTIRGLRPLLMSSPKEMFQTTPKRMKKKMMETEDVDTMKEAERRAYRDEEGNLCVPANCVLANIYTAAKLFETQTMQGKRVRDMSLVQKVKASINIEPENIPVLDLKGKQIEDYEVNASRVVNKATKGSIVRYRPQINNWQLRFEVKWNPQLYGLSEGAIQQIIKTAGDIGLLDWRPRHGIYELVSFELVEE